MTIRKTLRLLLAGIIAVPVICTAAAPIYHYATRPERILISGYKEIRKLGDISMSSRDVDVLLQVMKTLPPQVEFLILENDKNIIATNFSEFKGKKTINDEDLLKYMNETSQKYFYQLVSPPLKDSEVKLLSRVNRDDFRRKKKETAKILVLVLSLLAVFESLAIIAVASISRAITKSIEFLEKSTERIAAGEFDEPIQKQTSRGENEIIRLSENLDKMRLALKDVAERRAKFIMGISHDLRTPVAVIKGYTEALSDGMYNSAEEMQKSLEIISSKTEQLDEMINTLINFEKLNQADWRETLKEQKIKPLLLEFAEMSVTTGSVFKRNVEARIDLNEETILKFDPLLIRRALENLFSNAIRYSSNGDSIQISAEEENGFVIIKIADSGIGIDKKDIEQIFDMFYRGSASRRESGMGIGLAVVKTIIDTHGWKISVESQKGFGTEFVIKAKIC